jgi:hypothetical protein
MTKTIMRDTVINGTPTAQVNLHQGLITIKDCSGNKEIWLDQYTARSVANVIIEMTQYLKQKN